MSVELDRPPIVDISPAEVRALVAYLETGSTRKAAARLSLAESTVKNHLAHVRSRLGVETTAQAVFLLHEKLAD